MYKGHHFLYENSLYSWKLGVCAPVVIFLQALCSETSARKDVGYYAGIVVKRKSKVWTVEFWKKVNLKFELHTELPRFLSHSTIARWLSLCTTSLGKIQLWYTYKPLVESVRKSQPMTTEQESALNTDSHCLLRWYEAPSTIYLTNQNSGTHAQTQPSHAHSPRSLAFLYLDNHDIPRTECRHLRD